MVEKLIILQGPKSMTGLATTKEYPDQVFDDAEDFPQIMCELKKGGVLSVLPIWNSHVGEIKTSEIIDAIIAEELLIHAIWPDWIKIALIVRLGTDFGDIQKVVSMGGVIDKQCRAFLDDNNFTGDAFVSAKTTRHAYKQFCEDDKIDAVLCSAESCNQAEQIILRANVANPINFTSFVLMGREEEDEWARDRLSVLCKKTLPKRFSISCIEMPAIWVPLSDAQNELFENIVGDCEHIDQIPKIIFAAERNDPSKVAVLLEYETGDGKQGIPSPSSEDDIYEDIYIVNNAGSTGASYSNRVKSLLDGVVAGFSGRDFVKHNGTEACFFACPPLNIVTHGFNQEVVEAVIRKSIELHREAFNSGVNATDVQAAFLNKYKDKDMEDIDFDVIPLSPITVNRAAGR